MPTSVRSILAFVALVLAGFAGHAAAQAGENRAGHWYIGGGLGGFSEEDNPQITGQDAEFGSFFSGGYRASPNVAVEATAMSWTQDFATPIGTLPGQDPRTDLSSFGIGALVKFILPLDSVDLFAGVGLGLYATNLHVEGGGGTEIDETDTDLGLQAVLGADVFILRNISVGLEYRWMKLNANFEPVIADELDIGGHFFFATVRGYF